MGMARCKPRPETDYPRLVWSETRDILEPGRFDQKLENSLHPRGFKQKPENIFRPDSCELRKGNSLTTQVGLRRDM